MLTGSDDLARRFMHLNLNCRSLDVTEGLYAKKLGLAPLMRISADEPSAGASLGYDRDIFGASAFLYDARGGRTACSLEAIEWRDPVMKPDHNTDPVRPGIRSAFFTVNDLNETVTELREAGLKVSAPVTGLISDGTSVLAIDADGVVIELAEVPSELPGALLAGIRIAAVNAAATVEFLTAIGFVVLQSPTAMQISGEQFAPGHGGETTPCVVARLALPEDQQQFTVVVVEHPDTGKFELPEGSTSQGLYRCAMRVEDVQKTYSLLPDWIEKSVDPMWFPMSGLPLEGLNIAMVRSPDGVMFEFVERPLRYFSR